MPPQRQPACDIVCDLEESGAGRHPLVLPCAQCLEWVLDMPTPDWVAAVGQSLRPAGCAIEHTASTLVVVDPWQIRIRVLEDGQVTDARDE